MRPILLLSLLLGLLLSCAAVENRNVETADQAPVVRENELFSAVITVRNPHDRAVRVARLDATCSCAKLELKEKFLLPKAATTMEVKVDNRFKSGPQRLGVSVFLTDPDLDTIECELLWQVRPNIQVDQIPIGGDPLKRPERAYQDNYRFTPTVRPDELEKNLRRRIRLAAPEGEVPPGGLQVTAVEYPGTLWRFETKPQQDGSILLLARAKDPDQGYPEGAYSEKVAVRTNHPDKPVIELQFDVTVSKQAGAVAVDPLAQPPLLPIKP